MALLPFTCKQLSCTESFIFARVLFEIDFNFNSDVPGLASPSVTDFKDELRQYWFLQYSRSGGAALDSSGFEHVFLGEVRQDGSAVTGFHNWVQAYYEEKDGSFEYTTYLDTCQVQKKITSTFVCVSPFLPPYIRVKRPRISAIPIQTHLFPYNECLTTNLLQISNSITYISLSTNELEVAFFNSSFSSLYVREQSHSSFLLHEDIIYFC